mgnify:FL=1
MGKNNLLSQKVNFIISVLFMGSLTLLAILTILEADEKDNPIADAMEHTAIVQSMLAEKW